MNADGSVEDLGQRAGIAIAMLSVVAVAALYACLADLALLGMAQDMLGGRPVTIERIHDLDDQIQTVGIIQLATWALTAIAFLLWFHRAYRNGIALGARPPRFGTGWAVGYWFIPFVNLVRPKQVMNDIWRGSDPEMPAECPGFAKRPLTPLLTFWWAAFLISGFAARLGLNFDAESNLRGLEGQAKVFLFADLLNAAAAILAAVIVWQVTQRQAERRRRWEGGQLTGQALAGGPSPAPIAADPASKSIPPPGYS